jgi:hypothetical protein
VRTRLLERREDRCSASWEQAGRFPDPLVSVIAKAVVRSGSNVILI